MRIKSPLTVFSILLGSAAISSCLDSDRVNEFSSNATLTSFGIDTVHGIEYKFDIDQVKNLIFNRDSLPVDADTIIDKTLITTFAHAGAGVTSADTLFNMEDSVNLLPAMNKSGNDGMQFKIHAADGVTTRTYVLQVRVHRQDPDSLVWKAMKDEAPVFSEKINQGEQKAVVLKHDLLVFDACDHLYRTSTDVSHYQWNDGEAVTGLPQTASLSTMLTYNDALYALADGKVYRSANGTQWEEAGGLGSYNTIALLGNVNGKLAAIVQVEGTNRFATCDGNTWDETLGEEVPEAFPLTNITSTRQTNGNGVTKTYITGTPGEGQTATIPWSTENGSMWVSLETAQASCPRMDNPFIMHYGGQFYIFGGEMDAIYTGPTGIAWQKTERKFLLPEAFKGKKQYSIVVDPTVSTEDKRDFIWVVFGGHGTANEVWRGRLNRLGFDEP